MNFIKNKIYRIIDNENGFSLPIVLIVFIVFSILFTSAIFVTQVNTSQIDSQEDNLRAYYVARSGIDMAYAALMQEDTGGYNLKVDRLIDQGLNSTINHNDLNVPQVNPIGTVDITVTVLADEVEIHAESQMIDDSETDRLTFYFKKDNYSKNRWENK
ncbi:hypothetical protein QUF55_10485 [Clostridiaceae bacterium HSG29]|nr:hypothetical protein [Clostridiaceae bacterium HSG29]